MSKNTYFLSLPPDISDFSDLFRYVWLQGLGNKLDNLGNPTPWTDVSLESRFYELGFKIDKRSFSNWLSGKNKPSAKNLHKLAHVISNGELENKRVWRDALVLSAISQTAPVLETQSAPAPHLVTRPTPKKLKSSALKAKIPWFVGFMTLFVVSFIAGLSFEPRKILVTNIKTCDQKTFDLVKKSCSVNMTHFVEGISLVYVSFNMPNATEGQAFRRDWFRDGNKFLSKDGFVDSAWEDYTWIKNPNGHDSGRYDLRIIVNNRSTSHSFYIGSPRQAHKPPE